MSRSDAANRLERLLRRDLDEAAREAGPPGADEIDAYVAGRASAAEREVIESWLADDPALREEVAAVMAMRQAIEGDAGAAANPAPDLPAPTPAVTPTPAITSAPAVTQTPGITPAPPVTSSPAPASTATPVPTAAPAPGRTSTSSGAKARPAATRSAATRPGAPGSVHEAARQMRSQPLRTAGLVATAASLAFFILWITSPGRPPVDSERASGGAAPPSAAPSPSAAPAPTPGAPAAPAAPATTLTLRDAGGEVSLLADGELRGLDGVEGSHRSAVQFALAKGRLEILPQVDQLAASASALRAPGDAAAPGLRVIRPLATTVRTPRPTFEWSSIPGASSYRVRIANASLDPILESPELKATSWTPEKPLPAGRMLTWQVEAQTPAGPIIAPAPPAAEARVLVLDSHNAEALRRELSAANGSDLATAIALARFGVLDEADAALARLAAANANADAVVRLRQQLADRRFPR